MSVDAETVRKVAKLARISITEQEAGPLAAELSAILTFVERLEEVDVENVEPMTAVSPLKLKRRADAVTAGSDPDLALFDAPEAAEGFFVVPKVVE